DGLDDNRQGFGHEPEGANIAFSAARRNRPNRRQRRNPPQHRRPFDAGGPPSASHRGWLLWGRRCLRGGPLLSARGFFLSLGCSHSELLGELRQVALKRVGLPLKPGDGSTHSLPQSMPTGLNVAPLHQDTGGSTLSELRRAASSFATTPAGAASKRMRNAALHGLCRRKRVADWAFRGIASSGLHVFS